MTKMVVIGIPSEVSEDMNQGMIQMLSFGDLAPVVDPVLDRTAVEYRTPSKDHVGIKQVHAAIKQRLFATEGIRSYRGIRAEIDFPSSFHHFNPFRTCTTA